jgi:thiol-disulfide isomerase/thioredoxin
MWRTLLVTGLSLAFAWPLLAQDAAPAVARAQPAETAATEKAAADKAKENPNDAQAINAYLNEVMTGVMKIMQDDPDAALKKLDEMAKFAAELKADSPAAKSAVNRVNSIAKLYSDRIEIQRTPLADLEKKLGENPDDTEALSRYVQKMQMEIGSLARANPEEAEKQMDAAKAMLDKVSESAKEAATKTQVTTFKGTLARLAPSIEAGKKLAAVIGKDAAPLKVEAWVNGAPLTDADLKGKVVLLDFWAVWCGPCIATFPHLREWNEKYADKGLVMIGLTRYYQYDWNEATKRAARVAGTTPEKEQEMLVKFAESHGLKHRFGIQTDNSVSEYYGVTGIPHVVVIDQEGKVRLMRVGSGEQNAKDIEELLEKLLANK